MIRSSELSGCRVEAYARSGLLDHLSSNCFDYWSGRLFHFPFRFLHWRTFGLGLGNRPLRSLGYLACVRLVEQIP